LSANLVRVYVHANAIQSSAELISAITIPPIAVYRKAETCSVHEAVVFAQKQPTFCCVASVFTTYHEARNARQAFSLSLTNIRGKPNDWDPPIHVTEA
jgi:hypothetical protein